MPTFHTLHTVEAVLARVGASLLIKGIEKCSDKYCSDTEASQIVHEVAETIKHDVDEMNEFHNNEHKTLTPRSEPESAVYNFARNPIKLINKDTKKINVSHEYVHLQ